jgi:uncharacterized membrane protein YphA (DoxX/SURF4 family)
MRAFRFSQGLFAIASAGLAIYCLVYGDFAPAGTSLPAWVPWREIVVYASALLVLGASAGLCFSRTALTSVSTVGVYLTVWVLIGVPQIFTKPLGVDTWYGICEPLTALVGAWILYATLRWQTRGSQMPVGAARAVSTARVLFGLSCAFYGWSHFLYADYTASMVPTWLPGRLGFAYFTGLGHIAAGVGIVVGILPRLAATLEATMMSLFGLLVWVPSFFAQPRPAWALPAQNQWSELVVNLVLAACAWVVAISLTDRPAGSAVAPRSLG